MTIKNNGGIFGRNPTFNNLSVDGNVVLGDTKKAIFGAGSDLEISHNGTENVIDSNSGTLVLRSAGAGTIEFRDQGSQVLAQFNDNSSAKLYHNNNEKISTSSSGVSITGNVAFDSGNGIDFSATSGTGTSELFDDYEEGTWTPEFVDSAGNNDCAASNGSNGAYYTKIGNQVTCSFRWNKSGGTAVAAYLDGLPFTPSSTSGKASNVSIAYGDATQGTANETTQYRIDSTARITLVGITLANLPSVMRAEFTYFTN